MTLLMLKKVECIFIQGYKTNLERLKKITYVHFSFVQLQNIEVPEGKALGLPALDPRV